MNLVVVSPHLDDAVYSLGATISYLVRRHVEVTVLTVLAGDPSLNGPASSWDQSCGFKSSREACDVRRVEDAAAVTALGAQARWLPFADDGYVTPASRDVAATASALRVALDGYEAVALPVWPLEHPDHRWVKDVAASILREGVVTLGYAEEPYTSLAIARSSRLGLRASSERSRPEPHPPWSRTPTGRPDHRARAAAVRRYRSQQVPNKRLLWLAAAVRLIHPRERWTILHGESSELVRLMRGRDSDRSAG